MPQILFFYPPPNNTLTRRMTSFISEFKYRLYKKQKKIKENKYNKYQKISVKKTTLTSIYTYTSELKIINKKSK